MSVKSFDQFIKLNPNWEKDFNVYQRDDSVYKRIKCIVEKKHEYHMCINTKTGEIYFDCRRRKIWAKTLVLTIARPTHTIAKTLWHLSIIAPLAYEVLKVYKKEQTFKDLKLHTFQSFLDIGRTPFYGTVLTVLHISALVMGCIKPNTLYKTRALAGRLERRFLRIEQANQSHYMLSPCFSPPRNIAHFSDNSKDIKTELEKFARAAIRYKQTNRKLFNDCYRLLDSEKAYISAASKSSL